ncbi:helix-hairpin-helix domain-containing protein [Streptosporangium saharense]|uniref:helix-hairpin-helix domain-containing protein n=1 Tax=Streptosporangium saharense TaxID=1706840 RepID=UPI003698ED30
MRTTDQDTDRLRAGARLRLLTSPGSPASFGDGPGEASARRSDGPAGWSRSVPAPPFPPSFEALRTAVAAQGPVFGVSRSGLRVLVLVALVAAAVAGVHLWLSRPEPEALSPPEAVLEKSTPSPAAVLAGVPEATETPKVTVHVTGKVRRPGVITLPGGSRVTDALQAAGGVRGNASAGSLNLARRVIDGEQIVVGAPGLSGVAVPAPADPATVVLDLNTATPQQLEQLPGVGEVLARRIIEYRDSHGGFLRVEQLRDISGIGDRKYAELKDRVHT